ncbi:MAG TPA: alpha/beta hydrolase [Gemmatimonadaceae bacterium]|nr:alpha/beta hydrolase [Gemmatimonadaceae bacterium]
MARPALNQFSRSLALTATLLACNGDGEPTGPDSELESVDIVASCPPLAPPSSTNVNVETDVIYANQGGQTQRLDIAWPRTGGPHPLIVLVHGGNWSGGSRTDLHNEMLVLANEGYAAASIGYRLANNGQNIFPAAVEDLRCAVRWLRSNAADYDIDASRVGAVGISAGAHLVSMLGTASDVSGLDGACPITDQPVDVSAVLAWAGPHDLRVNGPYTQQQADIVTNFLGAFPGDAPGIAALASPVVHVTADDAAYLMVHGTVDGLVPIGQSRLMRDALHAAGVRATLIELAGVGHQFFPLGFGFAPEVGCTAKAFFEAWL